MVVEEECQSHASIDACAGARARLVLLPPPPNGRLWVHAPVAGRPAMLRIGGPPPDGEAGPWDMPYYRLYYLDETEHIRRFDEITVECDDEAYRTAQNCVQDGSIEVWQEGRRVARVFPPSSYQGG